ncbi:MAG: hypothetical protein D6738_12255, partial [Acidobacteria bacterium]
MRERASPRRTSATTCSMIRARRAGSGGASWATGAFGKGAPPRTPGAAAARSSVAVAGESPRSRSAWSVSAGEALRGVLRPEGAADATRRAAGAARADRPPVCPSAGGTDDPAAGSAEGGSAGAAAVGDGATGMREETTGPGIGRGTAGSAAGACTGAACR